MQDDRSTVGSIDEAALSAKRKAAGYVGQVVGGRYRVEAILALGGMGAVFRAEHVHMRKQVALKLLHPMTQNLPECAARFERESIVGAHVSHPNVCQATDFGSLDDGSHYLVLEYVEGRTLHEILKQGRLEPERAAEIAAQVAAGLGAAHALGIYHRDVKPSNLMLADGPEVQVKIVDFGLAKLPSRRFRVDEKLTITTAGSVFGTVAYMAPELARGMHAVDHRSDLYALGVILYEMLAGKRPFEAADPGVLFKLHRTQPPPPIAERAPGTAVPPALEEVVRKLLEKDPDARYQSADALIEALDAACPPALSSVPPARSSSRRLSVLPRDPGWSRTSPPAPEVVDPSDASPPPAAAPDEAPRRRPAARGGIRLLMLALVILIGVGASVRLVPEVRERIGINAAPNEIPVAPANPAHAAPPAGVPAAAPPSAAGVPPSPSAAATLPSSAAKSVQSAESLRLRGILNEAAAAHEGRRGALALLALAKAGPEAFRDHDVIASAAAITVAVALADGALADEVFAALGSPSLGEGGPDVLLQVTSFYGGSRGAARATELLSHPEVLEHASPALRVARELKSLPCKDRQALFDRAAAEGDERALALLTAMLAPECAESSGACCAPHDARLAAATAKLRQRLRR